jgi:hypothetical protein
MKIKRKETREEKYYISRRNTRIHIKMKITRKETREEKDYISRRTTRIQIWRSIDEFCCNKFGNLYFL